MSFDLAKYDAYAIAMANLGLTVMILSKMAANGSFPKEEIAEAIDFLTLSMEQAVPLGPAARDVCEVMLIARAQVMQGPQPLKPA